MKRTMLMALLLVAAILGICQITLSDCASCGDTDAMCGPNCLLYVCEQLGVKANVDELAQLSGKDKSGTTLAGLLRAAQAKGLSAVGMKIGVDGLASWQQPAIAHLTENHFLVVTGYEGGLLRVMDPPGEPQLISKSEFEKKFSGFALLLSRYPTSFPKADSRCPDIRFGSDHCDLGTVEEGERPERVLRIRNAGDEPLAVFSVRTSCTCIVATALSDSIPPKGEAAIKVSMDTTGRKGLQEEEVYIESNDPITPRVQAKVYCQVKSTSLLLSPRRVDFGEVKFGRNANRQIRVADFGDGKLSVDKAISDSPLVEAVVSRSQDDRHPGYVIDVELKSGVAIGDFVSHITLHTNNRKESQVTIPISASIVGDIRVTPETCFWGAVHKGKECKRTILISTTGKDKLKIEKIDVPFDHVSVEMSPGATSGECMLAVALQGSAPVGVTKGVLVVHTDSPAQREIRVPVWGLVDD